jgi:hypothetical protein
VPEKRCVHLKQLVEPEVIEIGEGFERISQPFYNGRFDPRLNPDLLVDELFDPAPVDRSGVITC